MSNPEDIDNPSVYEQKDQISSSGCLLQKGIYLIETDYGEK